MANDKRRDNKGRILRVGEMQRPDGRYLFSYKDPLTGKYKYVYSWKLERHDKIPIGKKNGPSLRELEQQIERDLRDGIAYHGGETTVLELVERYVEQKRNVRPTTKAGYRTVINMLKQDPIGNRRIDTIKTSDAKLWLISLQEGGRSYSAIHSIRGVLRPAFRMAVEDDLIRKNPFDFELASVLINDAVKRDALTPKQERAYLNFLKEDTHFKQYYDGIFLLFRTGLRVSELCGLTVKDIDMEERTFNVERQLQYTAGKTYIEKTKTQAGRRILPMSDEVYGAFQRVLTARKKPKMEYIIDGYTGFLFLDDKGKPMKAYQWEKKFKYSVDKYNSVYKEELPKITPHIARHTYCTNLVKRQVSVKTVQYLMGHSDISTTLNIYTHTKLEDAKCEMEELAMRDELKKKMSETGALEAKKELKRMRCV